MWCLVLVDCLWIFDSDIGPKLSHFDKLQQFSQKVQCLQNTKHDDAPQVKKHLLAKFHCFILEIHVSKSKEKMENSGKKANSFPRMLFWAEVYFKISPLAMVNVRYTLY